MISAINGPATVHAELPLLCDINLASEDAAISDAPHFAGNLLPGDGVHVFWPMVLGPNRARYFMLTGQVLTAQDALALGVVSEVMPRERLLPRARELAAHMLERPQVVRDLVRRTMTMELRRAMNEHLAHGLALEGLGTLDAAPI
jgi:enoyl-CoA hydratase/carnithine racemase